MQGPHYKSLSLWIFLHLYKFLGWLRRKLETAENFMKVKYENRLAQNEKHYSFGNTNTAFHEEDEVQDERKFSKINAENTVEQGKGFNAVAKDTETNHSVEKLLKASKTEGLDKAGATRALSENLTCNSAFGSIVATKSKTGNSNLQTDNRNAIRELLTTISDKDLHLMMKRNCNSEELLFALSSETLRSKLYALQARICNNTENWSTGNTFDLIEDCFDFLTKIMGDAELRAYGLIIQDYAIIIELIKVDGSTKSVKKTKKLRISVVTSEMFEEAMRHSQIQTIELTYTNVFPSDCRMFIGVPVYKGGYLNTKDQL